MLSARQSARNFDANGWVEIKDNPISRCGIFDYLGREIASDLEPDKVYKVYRPAEELAKAECLDSFRLLPFLNGHSPRMLGPKEGCVSVDDYKIAGVIGEKVSFSDGLLKGNLKVFSENLAELIEMGKKELSIGYRGRWDMQKGVYDGQEYDLIQRDIRGNHLALVHKGRAGKEASVLDHFNFILDSADLMEAVKQRGEQMDELLPKLDEIGARLDKLESAFAAMQTTDKDEVKEDEGTVAKTETKKDNEGYDSQFMDAIKTAVFNEMRQHDKLVNTLSKHLGTFDASSMSLQDVINYGVEKLGIECAESQRAAVLDGFLAAKQSVKPVEHKIGANMDAKPTPSCIDDFLNRGNK